MTFGEFLVEFMKACAMVLSAFGWPLVILVIFFVLLIRRDRPLWYWGMKKKMPLTWQKWVGLLSNLEQRHLSHQPGTVHEKRRHDFVCRELRMARTAAEQQNEKAILEAISNLSILAVQDDKKLSDWPNAENENLTSLSSTTMILPDLTETSPKNKSTLGGSETTRKSKISG